MASFHHRYPDNVPGKYYVDNQCTDCDLCRETAPDIFWRNDENANAYVRRQPTTPQEVALCNECVKECPVNAVGDDGDQSHPPPEPPRLKTKPWWRFW